MVAQPPIKPVSAAKVESSVAGTSGGWGPASWRTKVARQMPKYDDPELVKEVESILAAQAPLVFAGEVGSILVTTSCCLVFS